MMAVSVIIRVCFHPRLDEWLCARLREIAKLVCGVYRLLIVLVLPESIGGIERYVLLVVGPLGTIAACLRPRCFALPIRIMSWPEYR